MHGSRCINYILPMTMAEFHAIHLKCCSRFTKTGACPHGAMCSYAHLVEESDRLKVLEMMDSGANPDVCQWWLCGDRTDRKGVVHPACKNGDECKRLHMAVTVNPGKIIDTYHRLLFDGKKKAASN